MVPEDLLEYQLSVVDDKAATQPSSQVLRAAEIFRARPDIHGIVHLHSHGAVELAAVDDHLGVYYNVASLFHGQTALLPNSEPDSPGDYAKALGDAKVFILPNHGIYVTSDTLEHATIEAILFGQAAHHHVHAKAFGGTEMPKERIESLMQTLPAFRDHMWAANLRRLKDDLAAGLFPSA